MQSVVTMIIFYGWSFIFFCSDEWCCRAGWCLCVCFCSKLNFCAHSANSAPLGLFYSKLTLCYQKYLRNSSNKMELKAFLQTRYNPTTVKPMSILSTQYYWERSEEIHTLPLQTGIKSLNCQHNLDPNRMLEVKLYNEFLFWD